MSAASTVNASPTTTLTKRFALLPLDWVAPKKLFNVDVQLRSEEAAYLHLDNWKLTLDDPKTVRQKVIDIMALLHATDAGN